MSIGKNTTIGLLTDITVFGLGLLVSIVIADSLGAERRGLYVLLTTTNLLLTSLSHLGVVVSCSTLLAQHRYRLGAVNTAALLLAAIMGGVCITLMTLLYPVLQSSLFAGVAYDYLIIAVGLVPFTIYQAYWAYMMMGVNNLLVLNKLNLAVNLITCVLMIVAVGLLDLGIPGLLGVWTLVTVGGALGAALVAIRQDGLVWPPGRALLGEMLHFGLRSHGANVAHYLFLRFDVYVVRALAGDGALGVYSLATSLAEKLWLALSALNASSLGKIAELPGDESALLTARVSRTAVFLLGLLGLPFALASPWLIPVLYPKFADAALPLMILLLGTLGFGVMVIVNNYILSQMNRPGLLSLLSWAQLLGSIPLYVVLIGWLGIVGAAIASTITYLVAMLVTLLLFTRYTKLPLSAMLVPRRTDIAVYIGILGKVGDRLRGLISRVR